MIKIEDCTETRNRTPYYVNLWADITASPILFPREIRPINYRNFCNRKVHDRPSFFDLVVAKRNEKWRVWLLQYNFSLTALDLKLRRFKYQK